MNSVESFRLIVAAKICGVRPEVILDFISYDWISPINQEQLILDAEDMARIELICELKENLGVNDEAISIILHLIDQLNHLHLELRKMEH